MWEVVERITLGAPVERVWAVVSDIGRHDELAGSGEVLAIRLDVPVRAGATFSADVATGEVGSFVSHNVVEVFDPPHELRWLSYPPLDEGETADHQIVVRWWFRLAPADGGTDVEHGFHVDAPEAGAEQFTAFVERTGRIATVRTGMLGTLRNLKARTE